MNPKWKKRLVPVGIIAAGVAVAAGLIATGGTAEKTAPEVTVLSVQVASLTAADVPIPVRGTGVVRAAQEVALIPQVSGKIVWVSEQLRPGGRFAAGETLARIQTLDYQAALEGERARLKQAELELALETGRGKVAAREWALVREGEGSALALRRPHLALAEQNLTAAQGAVLRAEANLDRTQLRAPFDAVVLEESVDVGQVVGPGSPMARLVGTEAVWVSVSMPVSEIDVLQFGEAGSRARVVQRLADGRVVEHIGRALELGGGLDPLTRLVPVLVAVDTPFDANPGSLPLLPGAYVEVIFDGLIAAEAFRIPRYAIYDGDQVWLVEEGALVHRTVGISGGDPTHLLITSGLSPGELLVTSGLSLPIDGTPVRIISDNAE